MPQYRLLLRCVGGAVAAHGMRCLFEAVPFGERLYEIAKDAYERDKNQAEAGERLAEVERAARAPLEELKEEVAEVLREVQVQAAPDVRGRLDDPAAKAALFGYLV